MSAVEPAERPQAKAPTSHNRASLIGKKKPLVNGLTRGFLRLLEFAAAGSVMTAVIDFFMEDRCFDRVGLQDGPDVTYFRLLRMSLAMMTR